MRLLHSFEDWIYKKIYSKPPLDIEMEPLTQEGMEQIQNLNNMCFFVGTNRNLTTLTAGVLALHPNVQVLSHAGPRILPEENLNFLNEYSLKKFNDFCHFALAMSQGGRSGGGGGSIFVTHAFRHHQIMRLKYHRRYGQSVLKNEVKSLIWKEAHRTNDFILNNEVDVGNLLEANKKIRIMMPVRNPIHIAFSFASREGFQKKYYPKLHKDKGEINHYLSEIIPQLAWAIRLQKKYPEQIFIFYQYEVSIELFKRMAEFLQIEADKRWIQDALDCFVYHDSGYDVTQDIKEHFKTLLLEHFPDNQQEQAAFRKFIEG